MKRKALIAISSIAFLSACSDPFKDPATTKGNGELRQQLFVQCMELALKFEKPVTQLSLDDSSYGDGVAEITDACSDQAFYTARHIGASQ